MTAGRPREFDYDKALDQAIRVFWAKGYEGASMPDLTEAMGMNRPSVYAAFGNKEELFRKALARYAENAGVEIQKLLDVPRVCDAVERYLMYSADKLASPQTPRGCLAVQGALVGSEQSGGACSEASKTRERTVELLDARFKKAVDDGQLQQGTDTHALARFYTTIMQGMSVQSLSGVSCRELKAIAQQALKALPTIKV